MRALIVDDSRAMRLVIRRILGELGVPAEEAADGTQALDLLGGGATPDVALVDWNMPGMTGVELVQAVRADPRFAGLRIMMVTSETGADRIQEALASGADEYLMKPFTPEVLREKLNLLTRSED